MINMGAKPLVVEFTYPPSANRNWRMTSGRMVISAQARDWKRDAGLRARAAGASPLAGAVQVDVTLHPRMTASGKASRCRLDLDNVLKPCLDALNGVCWEDDKQVEAITARLGEPKPKGALTVHVEKLSNRGGI